MTPPPKLLAVIKVDMLALAGVVFPIVTLALAGLAALGIIAPDRWGRGTVPPASSLLMAAGVVALLGVLVVAWRVARIRRAFRGSIVEGTVTTVNAFRDRAYVSYRFALADGATRVTSSTRPLRCVLCGRVARSASPWIRAREPRSSSSCSPDACCAGSHASHVCPLQTRH